MALRERFYRGSPRQWISPQLAARTYATLSHYVLGFAIQLGGDRATGALDDAQLSAVFAGLNPAVFPATAAVADALPVPLEDEFAFGLETDSRWAQTVALAAIDTVALPERA